MRALPTDYKYSFPRRSEAKWAIFFDACGVDWEYTGNNYSEKTYIPTFLLHDVKVVTSLGAVTKDLYIEASFAYYYEIDEFIKESPLLFKGPVFKVGQIRDIGYDLRGIEYNSNYNKTDSFYSLSRVTGQNEFGILCLNKNSGIILCEYELYKDFNNLEYDIDKRKTYEAYFLANELSFNGGLAECDFYTKDENGVLHGKKHEQELKYLCDVSPNIKLLFSKKEYIEHWVNDDKIIKKKLPLIKRWRKENPYGNPHECMKATDSNFETVRAFWHESEVNNNNNDDNNNESEKSPKKLFEAYKTYKDFSDKKDNFKYGILNQNDFMDFLNNVSAENVDNLNKNNELIDNNTKAQITENNINNIPTTNLNKKEYKINHDKFTKKQTNHKSTKIILGISCFCVASIGIIILLSKNKLNRFHKKEK